MDTIAEKLNKANAEGDVWLYCSSGKWNAHCKVHTVDAGSSFEIRAAPRPTVEEAVDELLNMMKDNSYLAHQRAMKAIVNGHSNN